MEVEFKERWIVEELVLQCIRLDLAYKLSYRDLEEMMAGGSVSID